MDHEPTAEQVELCTHVLAAYVRQARHPLDRQLVGSGGAGQRLLVTSSAVDSAQIVYSIHATLAGLAADVWFEYVRTDANVADEPSRADLSGERYELGANLAAGIAAFAESEPIGPARPPELQEWDRPPAEWMVVGDDTPRHGGM